MSIERLTVTFDAFVVPNGTGPADLRIVIPKSKYILSSEDTSCYFIQPVESLSEHAYKAVEASDEQ